MNNTASAPNSYIYPTERMVEVAAEIAAALHAFLRSDTIANPNGGPDLPWCSEIRVLDIRNVDRKTGEEYKPYAKSAWFDKSGVDDLAAELAAHWCDGPSTIEAEDGHYAGGLYWTVNPCTPSHLRNYGPTLARRTTATDDVDIVARHWLPLDIDALRVDPVTGAALDKVSSTSAEKENARRLAEQVRDWLVGEQGWPEPVQVDSGNGYAHYYSLPGLPVLKRPDPKNPGCVVYDATSDTLVEDVIHALSVRFTGALGKVDGSVFNPSRIMKIPGTFARKAKHSPERPHRRSRLLYVPDTIVNVKVDQLQHVIAYLSVPDKRARRAVALVGGNGVPHNGPGDSTC